MVNGPNARIHSLRLQNPVPGVVRAGIIDEDQLKLPVFVTQSRKNLARQRNDVRGFVA